LFKFSAGGVAKSRARPPEVVRRELGIFKLAATFFTTCHTVFSEIRSPHSLSARQTQRNNGPRSIPAAASQASRVSFTQAGTGTERMCFPLPTRSTMAQRSSLFWMLSIVKSASSRRRSPHPSRIAKMARLRFPLSVCLSGSCQRADASPAVSQLPKRTRVFKHLLRDECQQQVQGSTVLSRQLQTPVAARPPSVH
jgi:hypothetical protein